MGLPLTAGPVAFFIALDFSPSTAGSAARGSLAGVVAEAAFALGYGMSARKTGWPISYLVGTLAFAAAAAAMRQLDLPLAMVFFGASAILAALLRFMPGVSNASPVTAMPPRWDIPLRMIVATGIVLTLTGLAPVLGATLAGMLATFPIFAGTLTVFAHHQQGGAAALNVLRGLLFGLFSFTAFFFALATALEHFGTALAFLIAIGTSLVVQGGSLWFVRREMKRSSSAD